MPWGMRFGNQRSRWSTAKFGFAVATKQGASGQPQGSGVPFGVDMIFKIKLREPHRPVKIRDGISGPMLMVTGDEWTTFSRWPEVPQPIADDIDLLVEVLTEITITPAPAAEVNESPPPAAPPRKKRRGRPPKKKEPAPLALEE